MARQAHPWFRRSDGWWYVKIQGKQTKLARGRKNRQAAVDRWHELVLEIASNPAVGNGEQTVASVIDAYLTHAKRGLTAETFKSRQRYLQWFAEEHGFRPVKDCLPIHLTQWLDSNTQWESDWTRATIVKTVQRAFNWAARQRAIAANPFLGVAQRAGEPRRPMTDEEFRQLLRATVQRAVSTRPGS
jgi:integrase